VQAAPQLQVRDQNRLPPGAGYPITVQEDGLIALPSVRKLKVAGMTVGEARDAIRDLYVVEKGLLKADNERIVVTLLYPRQAQILVFRQEATSFLAGQDGPVPVSKRNTGHPVNLPAHENDVLHALAYTGGLPDFDAYNEIIIYRDYLRNKNILADLAKAKPGARPADEVWVGETVRIPLRLPAEAPLPFSKNDVVLHTGDVVFLEARDEQVFYSAGLLPSGKHMLPRDHDLDVIEAIALVRGPLYNGAFGGSNLAGNLIQPGLGSPSPSLCVVLRRVPGRGQVPIAIDLRSAMLHPQERIPLRPGDVLVLQEKPAEAFARYFTQTFLNFEMMLNVFHGNSGFGVLDVAAPDRLGSRPGVFNAGNP
jgi:protein involved in polysaccharide export with SLBB domain